MIQRVLLSLTLATFLVLPATHHAMANDKPTKVQATLLQLERYSGGSLEVVWNPQTNTPSRLTGRLSQPSKHSPGWIALEFLTKWKTLYGLPNPNVNLRVVQIEPVRHSESVNVHLEHLLFHTPVWKDELVVNIGQDGVIHQVEGTIHPYLEKRLFNRPMHPAISKKQAIAFATAQIQEEFVNEPMVKSYYLPTRSGTPLVYLVTYKHRYFIGETHTMVHSLTGRVIE